MYKRFPPGSYRASNVLFNYSGEGMGFYELMECFADQAEQELDEMSPPRDDEPEDIRRMVLETNAEMAKERAKIFAAKEAALAIYDRHVLQTQGEEWIEQAAAEMKAHPLEWVQTIGTCLETNDWSKLAV